MKNQLAKFMRVLLLATCYFSAPASASLVVTSALSSDKSEVKVGESFEVSLIVEWLNSDPLDPAQFLNASNVFVTSSPFFSFDGATFSQPDWDGFVDLLSNSIAAGATNFLVPGLDSSVTIATLSFTALNMITNSAIIDVTGDLLFVDSLFTPTVELFSQVINVDIVSATSVPEPSAFLLIIALLVCFCFEKVATIIQQWLVKGRHSTSAKLR